MNNSARRNFINISIAYVLAIGILFFIGSLIYVHITKINQVTQEIYQSQVTQLQLKTLFTDLRTVEFHNRSIYTKEPEDDLLLREEYEAKVLKNLADLRRYYHNKPTFLKIFNEIEGSIHRRFNFLQKVELRYRMADNQDFDFQQNYRQSYYYIERLERAIENLQQMESAMLEKRKESLHEDMYFIPTLIYSILGAVLIFLSFYFYKNWEYVETLRKYSSQMDILFQASNHAEAIGNHGSWQYNTLTETFLFSENEFKLLGATSSDFTPSLEAFLDFVHPEDYQYVKEKAREMIQHHFMEEITYRIIRKDNREIRWFRTNAKLVNNLNKEWVIVGTTQDVTSQILAQQYLEERNIDFQNKNRIQSILLNTHTAAERIGHFGTWQWHTESDTFSFSDNIYEIYGLEKPKEQHNAMLLMEFCHPDDAERVNKIIDEVFETKNLESFNYRIIHGKTSEIRYLEVNGKYIQDSLSDPYLLVIVQDITQRAKFEREIAEQNEELRANNEELSNFNHLTSHDLQEPLRKIETFLCRLKDSDKENISPRGLEDLKRVVASANRMRNLIQDLLQYSNTSRNYIETQPTNLNHVIDFARKEIASALKEKNGQILVRATLPTLQVSTAQFEQVFINIFENSIKYSRSGFAPLIQVFCEPVCCKIDPRIKNEKEWYRISIQDNGIGFEPQYSEKIFKLFHRLHSRNEYSGTGIGLSIVKKIIERHKGMIFAESVPGQSSTFHIYLPKELEV